MYKVFVITDNNHFKLIKKFIKKNDNIALLVLSNGISIKKKELSKLPTKSIYYFSIDDKQIFTQKEISKLSVDFVKSIINYFIFPKNSKTQIDYLFILQNMIALNIHPITQYYKYLNYFMKKFNFGIFYFFGKKNMSLNLPERLDIKFFLSNEVFYYPISIKLANKYKIKYKTIDNNWLYLASIKISIRSFLLSIYKNIIILKRILTNYKKIPLKKDTKYIDIIIRAESEWWSIEPLVKKYKSKYNIRILQDDLLKNPSAKKILDKEKINYIPLHAYISIWEFFKLVLKSYKDKKNFNKQKELDFNLELGCISFTSKEILSLIKPSFSSLLELYVHEIELNKLIKIEQIKLLITLDMIDQWGAVQGAICKQKGIPSITIQNTALDNIYYPIIPYTDYFFVQNVFYKNLLLKSSKKDNIISCGVPMYDNFFNTKSLNNKLIISEINKLFHTNIKQNDKILLFLLQPFIQKYPYNYELIFDLMPLLQKIKPVVLVKIHPRQKKKDYQKYIIKLNQFGIKSILIDTYDLNKLFAISEIVISRTSTALQSSLLAKVYTISYLKGYPADIIKRLNYLDTNAIYKCINIKDYNDAIELLLEDESSIKEELKKNINSYIKQHFGEIDGNSSLNIMNFIESNIF